MMYGGQESRDARTMSGSGIGQFGIAQTEDQRSPLARAMDDLDKIIAATEEELVALTTALEYALKPTEPESGNGEAAMKDATYVNTQSPLTTKVERQTRALRSVMTSMALLRNRLEL